MTRAEDGKPCPCRRPPQRPRSNDIQVARTARQIQRTVSKRASSCKVETVESMMPSWTSSATETSPRDHGIWASTSGFLCAMLTRPSAGDFHMSRNQLDDRPGQAW